MFQQDSAPSHWAKVTLEYLEENTPRFISPDKWAPNAQDANPYDYHTYGHLEQLLTANGNSHKLLIN